MMMGPGSPRHGDLAIEHDRHERVYSTTRKLEVCVHVDQDRCAFYLLELLRDARSHDGALSLRAGIYALSGAGARAFAPMNNHREVGSCSVSAM